MNWKKMLDDIRDIVQGKGKKKTVENLVIVIILGIVIMLAGGTFFKKSPASGNEAKGTSQAEKEPASVSQEDSHDVVEQKMEEALMKIVGAGKVSVMIMYDSGREIVPAYSVKKSDNQTQEKDAGGGTRSTMQNQVDSEIAYEETQGGNKKPIVLKEVQPAVKGVVVIAEGADDPSVRADMTRAVTSLLDVPAHKVQVFTMQR